MDTLNIVFADKEKVEVRKETLETSLGPSQLLCAARCSLISTGTEMQCLKGVFDADTNWAGWVRYPFRPGYSMVAEVLDAGTEVRGIRKGDRVFVENAHAQYFKTDAGSVCLLPDGISDEQGAWINLTKTTQLGVRRAELQLGETVGVIGLGLLGQLVTQYLALSGVQQLFAIDPAKDRLKLIQERPGLHLLAMDAGEAQDEIRYATEGRMLDAVFDVTGHPAVLARATKLVKPLGRVILLGDTATPSRQEMGHNVVSNSVSILGIHGTMTYRSWTHSEMAGLFIRYLLQRRMEVSGLITHRYSPLEAAAAYDLLAKNRSSAMGVMLDWTKLPEESYSSASGSVK